MSSNSRGGNEIGRKIRVLEGVLPIDRSTISLEVIAGITLAALAIPEVMGYAIIAGVPVVLGLYSLLVPMVVYAVFGGSRHLVVGADSATAAITATVLVTMAAPESPEYIALAGMIALLAGGFLILSRLLRLGFVADFLSRAVLIGFLAGVGIQVALSQVPGMLGVPTEEGVGPILQIVQMVSQGTPRIDSAAVALSILVLALVFTGNRFFRRIPWALVAVIGTIVASWVLDLPGSGVTTIGTVTGGLPAIGLPVVPLDRIPDLIGVAIACFLVILAQSAATSRAYAARYEERFDENVDLVGLGLSNIAAALSGTFVVNGSPTKTEMVDSAGGRSQLAQLVTVGVVLIVLLFLTLPLSYLPSAVLAAIVFAIGIRLIDIGGMRTVLARHPVEFWVALLTALTVVFVSVGWGIAIAIVLSVIAHLRHSYRPVNVLLYPEPSGRWDAAPLDTGTEALPGLAVYRFGADLYYANEGRFTEDVLALVRTARPPLRWLCLSAIMMADIDFSGAESLKQVQGMLKKRGIELVMSDVSDPVMRQLERDGIIGLIGRDHVFDSFRDAAAAYQASPGGS